MKRTPIKPGTKPMKRTPMSRGLTGLLSSASFQFSKKPAKRMKSRMKAIPAAEKAHYKRVAALPCARCGIETFSQAAHSNRYQDGKGARLKADYLATFPLCCDRPGIVGCHYKHDQCIDMTREEADARTDGYIADTKRKLGI
ncbi:hypothetical protein [Glaciimonas sp. PCH181]|uniref:hypothetical protein n=1 Tax=Glaciimonas sp. PCH181 TaxID=2133943 RepID=UPI0011B22EEE|nr:hypothetical protein [Glaciimonas sp. PCH181]